MKKYSFVKYEIIPMIIIPPFVAQFACKLKIVEKH